MSVSRFQSEDSASQLIDLDQAQAKLENAASENSKEASGPSSNALTSAFVTEALLSMIAPAPVAAVVGVAAMVASEFLGSDKKKTASNGKVVRSNFFVPKGPVTPEEQQKQQPRGMGVSMMPIKPADQKIIARMTGRSLDMGSLKIAEMSLRGTSLTGAAPKPASGMSVDKRAGGKLLSQNNEIRQSLDAIYKAKKGPMSLSRMEYGLSQGFENAEQSAKGVSGNSVSGARIKHMSQGIG